MWHKRIEGCRCLSPGHGWLGLLTAIWLGLGPLMGAAGQVSESAVDDAKVQVSSRWLHREVRPGGQTVLAVVLDMIPGWHVASDAGQAVEVGFSPYYTKVQIDQPDPRLIVGEVQYPQAHRLPVGGLPDPIPVFDGRAVIYLPVQTRSDASPGPVEISISVSYQACDDKTCDFPQTVELNESLVIVESSGTIPEPDADTLALFEGFDTTAFAALNASETEGGRSASEQNIDFVFIRVDPSNALGFTLLLVLAGLGGVLLNFTPCVLPVIPIKILGLAQTAGNRKKTLLLGATMSLGVVAFWLGLGVAIAGVSGFTASNQLFQYPWFSITVGLIIAIMAVGMCGLFSLRLPNFVYSISPKHDSYVGSFGFGVMTAVLSTPCTAPMMGAAAAWAAGQSPSVTLATFAAIGVGMALPYLILSASPKLVDALPRSGPGSELLKQVMGLLMLAAAAFFVGAGVSGMLSDGTDAAPKGHWWVVAGFVALAGVWLIIGVFKATPSSFKRGVFTVLGLVLVVGSLYTARSLTEKDSTWVYYTPERLEQALADGNVVLLDFTADWCANCHLLEQTVLSAEPVQDLLQQSGYVAMKVDLTGGYPEGKTKLKQTGSVTIPWLVIYSPDGREVFKANWYTVEQIVKALQQARKT